MRTMSKVRGHPKSGRRTAVKMLVRKSGAQLQSAAKRRKSWSGGVKFGVSKSSPRYDIVGRTRDGVSILRPKVKPKHFTSKQIRKAIIEVENATSD
jgi:hypothetical protein